MFDNGVLYLDHNATTPCDERVVQAMLPYFTDSFWNPGSSHALGRAALRTVEDARERMARALQVSSEQIVYTSGATEAIQRAIEGLPRKLREQVPHFTSPVEHRAIRNSLSRAAEAGASVQTLCLNPQGVVDTDQVREPGVYVIQAANSETGLIQPIEELYRQVQMVGGLLIVDAAQALWKMDIAPLVRASDALILSAHKSYGPKGIGALIVSDEMRRLLRTSKLEAQDQGIREGTLNIPLIVGFSLTAELVAAEGHTWRAAALEGRDHLENLLISNPEFGIEPLFRDRVRLPNTAALRINGVHGDVFVANALDVAVSYGTACSSGAPTPSAALLAFGLDERSAFETVRVSFGRDHDRKVAETAATALTQTSRSLRTHP